MPGKSGRSAVATDVLDMSTILEAPTTDTQARPSKTHRIGPIVRWAARLTSIPILCLLLTSLIPALASFGISAKDDRIIALGMCATVLGFVLAWRWAGLGGGMAGVGVAAMLAQADGSILGDPFSIAFGLQAILFLISWIINSPLSNAAAPQIAWVKRAAACALILGAGVGAAMIVRGPGPTPLAKEKEVFTGVWESTPGFEMEITADGRAAVSQAPEARVEACNTPLRSAGRGDFLITFPTDERLQLTRGALSQPKLYHIDRRPFKEGKTIKMILNASDPYKASSAIVLVKKQTPGSKTAVR